MQKKNVEKYPFIDPAVAGIYLHIPFCRQACSYCNFHFSTSLKLKDDLLRAMMIELELQRGYLDGRTVSTIYFGGGTPSMLTSGEINMIVDHISKYFIVSNLTECTLEANPDDLSKNYLHSLTTTAINRLSIGVQSFRDDDLKFMNRSHDAGQADYAIKAAQDAGFGNLSIDLIYGTPGLSDAGWKNNLAALQQLQIPHFSAYALTVEEKTALHSAIVKKKILPFDPEQAAGQFEILMDFAAAKGYEHYEISNFALPGKYARHNTNYWMGNHYLGIGPAAHSFNGATRKWNIANNALYINGLLGGRKLNDEQETLTPSQRLNEYIMTSLRTQWGCSLSKISLHWGSDAAAAIAKTSLRHIEKGLLLNNDAQLTLTNEGKLFADRIASELFVS